MAAATVDPAVQALNNFNDPNLWVRRDHVPIFDRHVEHSKDGKVAHDFDEAKLRDIAERSNRREQNTGDACPITIGHTRPGKGEQEQPPVVGYARNFRVGRFGPRQKLAILATFYFKKNKYKEAMTYPRRSVELWPGSWEIDPIALLRRTPQRDLGLLTDESVERYYRENSQEPVAYARKFASGRVRLIYSMDQEEQDMDEHDQAPANAGVPSDPNSDELSPEDAGKAMQYMKHYEKHHPVMKHMCAQYAKEQGGMAADPNLKGGGGMDVTPKKYDASASTFVPSGGGAGDAAAKPAPAPMPPAKEDDAMRMQREEQAIMYARQQMEIAQSQEKIEALEKALDAERKERKKARAEQVVIQMQAEGFDIDRGSEVNHLADLDETKWDERKAYVRRYHKNTRYGAPIGRPVETAVNVDGPKRYSHETVGRAVRLVEEKKIEYPEALKLAAAEDQ